MGSLKTGHELLRRVGRHDDASVPRRILTQLDDDGRLPPVDGEELLLAVPSPGTERDDTRYTRPRYSKTLRLRAADRRYTMRRDDVVHRPAARTDQAPRQLSI